VALTSLGLTFPITDYAAAWRTVQIHVINALDTIRAEVSVSSLTEFPGLGLT
jgi:hypothetical protein